MSTVGPVYQLRTLWDLQKVSRLSRCPDFLGHVIIKCNLGLPLAKCLDYAGVFFFQVSTLLNRFHCIPVNTCTCYCIHKL